MRVGVLVFSRSYVHSCLRAVEFAFRRSLRTGVLASLCTGVLPFMCA
jgi:hypothetical protein